VRHSFPPPPEPDELRHLLIHEIVRVWPETLDVLEAYGITPAASGGECLASVLDDETRLVEALEVITAWRREGHTSERPSP